MFMAFLEFFRKNSTVSMTSGNQFLAVPPDFLSVLSMRVTKNSSKIFLDHKDLNYIETFNPNSSTTGTPRYYSIFDKDSYNVNKVYA